MKSHKLLYALIATLIICSIRIGLADDDIDNVRSKLPKLLGSTNVGNDFWFTIPPCYDEAGGGHDNYIKLFVTSMFETTVNVEVPGKGFQVNKKTVPNNVIEFNITPTIGQCYLRSPSQPSVAEDVYPGDAIHIYSTEPVIVYCVVRYYATSDGFLLIPVSALGDEYIIASYGDMGEMYSGRYPSLSGIVAAYDNTEVSFTLGGNEFTTTGGGLEPGETSTETLNKGDVWMFSSDNDDGDLTGSKVSASKPVAVVSGNFCTNIPISNRWCDYTVEMDQPTYTWGLDYHVAKVPGRLKAPIIRVFAKENNTQIKRDGQAIGYIQQAGGIISEGYLEMRLVPFESTPRSAVISGDKPINVVLYNAGVEEDGTPLPNSDPFVMGTIPMENHYNDLTFCTPGILGGYGFSENYINLVFETDQPGVIPEDMEFAEVQDGEFEWNSLTTVFDPEVEDFQYDISGKKYAVTTITLPKDGVYRIRAEKPFAAYSFGYAWCDSYGYPAGGVLMDPNADDSDTEPPLISWAPGERNKIEGAGSDEDTEASSIRAVFFHESVSENCTFTCDEFIPGKNQSINWEVKIADIGQAAKAVITFADQFGNDTTVKVSYSPPHVELKEQVFNFGRVDLGKTFEHEYTLMNLNTDVSQHIENIALEFGNRGFSLELPELPLEIPALDSVKFKVIFSSENPGTFLDILSIQDQYDNLLEENITIQASDIYQPKITVSDINFGKITVDEPNTLEFTISNTGEDELIIYGYEGPENSIITSTLPELDEDSTLNIEKDGERTFSITVTPDKAGDFSDNIEFQSNAASSDNICYIAWNAEEPEVKTVYVSDVDFENIDGQSETTKEFFIRNTGDGVLNVNGFTGPTHDFISIEGPDLPAQVEEKGQLDFTVKITPPDQNIPEFRDTIYFDTDADDGDAILVISAAVQSDVEGEPGYDYGITLYPLPANEFITIENSDEFFGKTLLKVSDIEGKLIISREIVLNPGEKFKLDVSGLNTGTYMLQMEAGGKIFVGKITIER